MAKHRSPQKAQRALQFMMGLRQPRIARALAEKGFAAADLEEGQRLLCAVAGGTFAAPATPARDPTLLAQLDAWENHWFPVVSASLRARHPALHAFVFHNLGRTQGPTLIVTVHVFLERIGKLATQPGGDQARALLTSRGLTDDTLERARHLLRQLQSIEPVEASAPEPAWDEADARLWAWLREWSDIARVVIKDRRDLRALGVLLDKRAERATEADDTPPSAEPD